MMWARLAGERSSTGEDLSQHLNAVVMVEVPRNCVILDLNVERASNAFERVRSVIKERVERAFTGRTEVVVSDETVRAVIAAYVG